MINCTDWKLRNCILSIIVVFELFLFPISRASFKFFLFFPIITSVSHNFLEFCFVDVVSRWFFATETPTEHPAFMIVAELWEAKVSNYTNDVLARGHQYKHVSASRLELATV